MQFHDVLHVFRAVRGTGIASFKSNLLQKLTVIRGKVLYEVFPNLQNLCGSLEIGWCMDILVGYGIFPQMERILR